jgi:hypothetical protein
LLFTTPPLLVERIPHSPLMSVPHSELGWYRLRA